MDHGLLRNCDDRNIQPRNIDTQLAALPRHRCFRILRYRPTPSESQDGQHASKAQGSGQGGCFAAGHSGWKAKADDQASRGEGEEREEVIRPDL